MIGIGLGIGLGTRRRSRSDVLSSQIAALFGASNILSLRLGSDWAPDGNGKIAVLSARYGAHGTSLGTELATRGFALGHACAVWSAGASACYYSDVSSSLCNIAVCQYDGTLPFPGYGVVLWDPGSNPIYEGSGTSQWAGGTAFRIDNAITRNADNGPHVLISDAATTPGTAGCTVASAGTGSSKFVGKIFMTARLAVRPTTAEYAQLQAILKSYFSFLP